jgi:NarL family two-component system response regulator LiaR
VLIVDDHGIVREGLRAYLELNDDIEVVGEAENGVEAVTKALELDPDIVLMDLVLPELDGIEATRKIREGSQHIKVIALTSFAADEKVFPAIEAGATSYLLKDVKPKALLEAILAAHRGESQLHPKVMKKLLSRVAQQPASSQKAGLHTDLTRRELEVLQLVAQGLSNRALAQALTISEKTVKTHISNILSKLRLADRTQAAIYAHKHDLVPPDA